MIHALIADDEALAREGIRLLLKDETDVKVVGEAEDGDQTVEEINRLMPDLVFLDVQMPGLDGFGVLARIEPGHLPRVIFVTAHNTYAVGAFEAQAIDYLLKPVSDDRFQKALQRARRDLLQDGYLEQTQRKLVDFLKSHLKPPAAGSTKSYPRWLTVKQGRRITLVKVDEVDWIDSAANYVQLHACGRSYLIRSTMGEFENNLDPQSFVRIHRTTIVNVERVHEIDLDSDGDIAVKLRDGTVLRSSRGYRERLTRIVPL